MKNIYLWLNLLIFLFFSFNSISGTPLDSLSQLPDTIYVADCSDLEYVDAYFDYSGVNDLVDFAVTYYFENFYDADSNCLGASWNFIIIHWLTGTVDSFKLVVLTGLSNQDHCGELYLFELDDFPLEMSIADLVGANLGLSLSLAIPSDTVLEFSEPFDDILQIPVFYPDLSGHCSVNIGIIACDEIISFEVQPTYFIDIGLDHCYFLQIDSIEINADSECQEYEIGFLKSNGEIAGEIGIPYTQSNPNRTHNIDVAMRLDDGTTFTRTLVVEKVADNLEDVFFQWSSNADFLNEGERALIGVFADLENVIALSGEIGLPGVEAIEITYIHPALSGIRFDYALHSTFMRFIANHPQVQPFDIPGTDPLFIMEVEALNSGPIEDLLDFAFTSGMDIVAFNNPACPVDIVQNYYYQFDNSLAISSADRMVQEPNLVVFPNPTSDQISWKGGEEFNRYKIFDTVGRKISEGELSGNSVEINRLVSGLYKIFLFNNTTSQSAFFMVE